MHFVTVIDSST